MILSVKLENFLYLRQESNLQVSIEYLANVFGITIFILHISDDGFSPTSFERHYMEKMGQKPAWYAIREEKETHKWKNVHANLPFIWDWLFSIGCYAQKCLTWIDFQKIFPILHLIVSAHPSFIFNRLKNAGEFRGKKNWIFDKYRS